MANMGTSIQIDAERSIIFVNTDPRIDCSVVIDTFDRYIGTYLKELGLDGIVEIIRINEEITDLD